MRTTGQGRQVDPHVIHVSSSSMSKVLQRSGIMGITAHHEIQTLQYFKPWDVHDSITIVLVLW